MIRVSQWNLSFETELQTLKSAKKNHVSAQLNILPVTDSYVIINGVVNIIKR